MVSHPTGKEFSPTGPPPTCFSTGCHLCVQLVDQQFPPTPSSSSSNLLEWLIELRETVYSLDNWFMIKGHNSGTARWKRCTGQGMWGRHHLPAPLHVYHPGSPLVPRLWCFYGDFSKWVWLIKSLVLGLSQPPAPSWRKGGKGKGWNSHLSKHTSVAPGNQPLSLGAFQKSSHNKNSEVAERGLSGITKDTFIT